MKLTSLLTELYDAQIPPNFQGFDVKSISCDSRSIGKDSLFIALKGTQKNGSDFVDEAIAKGAKIIIRENCLDRAFEDRNVFFVHVKDSRKALLKISRRFYDDPSRKVKAIGVTGTNGKTTVSYLLESVFRQAKKKCAVIGTVNYRIGEDILPSKNTTPGLLDNQRYLAEMAAKKVDYCAMEVSSHALDQGRVGGIDFCSAIFTNLTGDHMDYHVNMENYFLAKSKLFVALTPNAAAVINTDDDYGKRLTGMAKGKIMTYALKEKADVTAEKAVLDFSGTAFVLCSPQGKISVKTKLIGRHNIYNILAAAGACLSQGMSLEDIRRGIESLTAVPGRLEQIHSGQDFHVFVDYAHTEDALHNVLTSLKSVNQAKSKIILVFGCGGDRDRTKRPKMGRVASALADFVVITSDNPRSEDPKVIVDEVVRGCEGRNFEVILDRKDAIQKALSLAGTNDVVLIAGKGHEDYQIFKDKTVHFDDREIVKGFLNAHH